MLFNFLPLLPTGCVIDTRKYENRLYTMATLPLVCIILVFVVECAYNNIYIDPKTKHVSCNRTAKRGKKGSRGYHVTYPLYLLGSFSLYTAVSTAILQYGHCNTLEDGHRYLAIDPSLNCADDAYVNMSLDALIFGIIYCVLIPLSYALILGRHRKDIMEEEKRDGNRKLEDISFLWGAYKKEYYLMEVFDMIRKLVFIGLPMILPDYHIVLAGGVLWTIIWIIIYEQCQPFIAKENATLMRLSQMEILLTLFGGLLVKYDVTTKDQFNKNASNVALSVVLIVTTVGILLLPLISWCISFHQHMTAQTLGDLISQFGRWTSDRKKTIRIAQCTIILLAACTAAAVKANTIVIVFSWIICLILAVIALTHIGHDNEKTAAWLGRIDGLCSEALNMTTSMKLRRIEGVWCLEVFTAVMCLLVAFVAGNSELKATQFFLICTALLLLLSAVASLWERSKPRGASLSSKASSGSDDVNFDADTDGKYHDGEEKREDDQDVHLPKVKKTDSAQTKANRNSLSIRRTSSVEVSAYRQHNHSAVV